MNQDYEPTRITLDETLVAQRDLDSLCGERVLDTGELFAPNAYYGNDLALKAYCGWPTARPLKAIIPHGVVFNGEYTWESERRSSLPVILAYPDFRVPAYRQATRKLVVPGTAPFVFVCRLMRQIPAPQRSGTLFFPAHSTHGVTVQTDHHAIAERLSRLDSKYRPVRICIYWKDYLAGRHLPYAARGFEIVSAGHMFDPRFMFRLYHLLCMHRFAASTTEGSYIFYAVLAGCVYFHLQGFDVECLPHSAANRDDVCTHPEADAVVLAFSGDYDEVTPRQRQIVEAYMGADNIASPAGLRKVLETADALDRYGLAPGLEGVGFHWGIPAALPRSAWRVMRRLFSAAGKAAKWNGG